MHEGPRKKSKKQKTAKTQYIIWWKPDGGRRLEFGPIYDKKTAKRDAFHYQHLYGEDNAGWEVYDPNKDRPRRDYRRRY